jgi:hypothetical protein
MMMLMMVVVVVVVVVSCLGIVQNLTNFCLRLCCRNSFHSYATSVALQRKHVCRTVLSDTSFAQSFGVAASLPLLQSAAAMWRQQQLQLLSAAGCTCGYGAP